MRPTSFRRSRIAVLAVLLATPFWLACGGGDTGPEDTTGTLLQGTVTAFQAQVVGGGFALAATEGVTVAIGSKSTETDANGNFTLRDFGIGTQNAVFSRNGGSGIYVVSDIERGDSYFLYGVQVNGGQVSTQHTGTWVGTGGSTAQGSQGPIALTMTITRNGNSLSGTASIADIDTTTWDINGTENGRTVSGKMTVNSTNSECASGGTFEGAFKADTLACTFLEVHTDSLNALCGPPEAGVFTVVKQ